MAIIGGFYVLTLFIGNGAALNVGAAQITAIDKGGNMAGPLLAQFIGGGAESLLGNLFLAFVAAVAFATIVAVVAGLVLASASAMSHDIWVGVVKGEHATQEEEVRAARVSALIVGAAAILIGILAKGQNVAHLVALAFAVAASSNLPCVLLTLYWKRCNTGGIVLGMLVGAFSAIALVMVSPNMTYPKLEKERAQKSVDAALPRIATLEAEAAAAADPEAKSRLESDLGKARKDVETAQATLKRFEGQDTSLVGLEEPLITLRNPGLYSIPLGFLCVIIGSLLWRDRKSQEMWEELYVRQNTGIAAEQAVAH
jgi:cation/acetate symporter